MEYTYANLIQFFRVLLLWAAQQATSFINIYTCIVNLFNLSGKSALVHNKSYKLVNYKLIYKCERIGISIGIAPLIKLQYRYRPIFGYRCTLNKKSSSKNDTVPLMVNFHCKAVFFISFYNRLRLLIDNNHWKTRYAIVIPHSKLNDYK